VGDVGEGSMSGQEEGVGRGWENSEKKGGGREGEKAY